MKYLIITFLLVFSLSIFALAPQEVHVVNLPPSDQAIIDALVIVADNQVIIINRLDTKIFLMQTICVTLGFIWGCAVIHMAIVAKNQRSLI